MGPVAPWTLIPLITLWTIHRMWTQLSSLRHPMNVRLAAHSPTTPSRTHGWRRSISTERFVFKMNVLVIAIAVIAIVLLFVGGFSTAVHWLLWVGIVLLIIAAIVWLLRFIGGRKSSAV